MTKTRLKSNRPRRREVSGVRGLFGVLAHSEWSRVPESRLSRVFQAARATALPLPLVARAIYIVAFI